MRSRRTDNRKLPRRQERTALHKRNLEERGRCAGDRTGQREEERQVEDAVEFSGRTVDDAIAQAERHFGLGRGELEISVITPGSRGVFGIGAEAARVRARPPVQETAGAEEMPADDETDEIVVQEASSAPESVESFVVEEAVEEETEPAAVNGHQPEADLTDDHDLAEQGREVLLELLDVMGFNAEVSVRSEAEPIMLAVRGDDLGVLIGRRGDNLAALQFMVNLILSKNRRQWPRIVVDIENYREKREESLRALADRIGQRVRRSGRAFTLEAMPAGDRRIIHLTLRDAPDVETYSIGEGPARRVVVAPKRISRGEASRASS